VGSAERAVTIHIELVANEGAVVAGGVVPVNIFATVSGPLPAQSGQPETYIGSITVTPHVPRDALCGWTREFADDDLRIQISQPAGSGLSVQAGVTFNPSWHYNVACPGGAQIRYPAGSAEVSLGGYLALIFPGQAGVTGTLIATPVYSGTPDCVRRYGEITGSNEFGTGKIRVYVHEPNCLLPADD
jgi:hypothetical protein